MISQRLRCLYLQHHITTLSEGTWTAMFNYALLTHQTNFSVFSESITLFENFLREYPNSQYSNQVNDILAEAFLTTKTTMRHWQL